MWIVLTRAPRPDLMVWPGRRWLACIDSVAWPAAWIALALYLPRPGGIVLPVIMAIAMLFAVRRCWRAVCQNERYRFMTWRWGYPLLMLLTVGMLIKLSLIVLT